MSAKSFFKVFVVWSIAALLIGCGSGIRGTYSGKDTGFLDEMAFKSGGKVDLTFMGMTKEGSYEVEGKTVKITNAGETTVLTIDDQGCLDGGGMIGRYCKGAEAKAAAGDFTGRYVAGESGDGISLEFHSDKKVHLTIMDQGAESNAIDGTYDISGEKVTVRMPGVDPVLLTRRGNELEGNFGGSIVRFAKR
jgi:hypothetical protein